MENQISSKRFNKNNKNKTITQESSLIISNISNKNSLETEASQNDPKENKTNKTKELLQKLLKETLEQRLIKVEKDSKNHFLIINTSKELTKTITNIAVKMSKQIQEKAQKNKEKNPRYKSKRYGFFANNNKKGISPHKMFTNTNRITYSRAKTPSYLNKYGNHARGKSSVTVFKRNLIKNRPTLSTFKSSKTLQADRRGSRKSTFTHKIFGKKRNSNSRLKIIKNNMNDDSNLDDLQTISVTSIKTNKSNNKSINTCNNSRTNIKIKNPLNKGGKKMIKQITDLNLKIRGTKITNMKKINYNSNINISRCNDSEKNLLYINKKKINNSNLTTEEKKKKRKTPFNKKYKNRDNENNKIINLKKKDKTLEDEIEDILCMEYNLQKETELNGNDPLLILPLRDLDFAPKNSLRKSSIKIDNLNNDGCNYFYSLSLREKLQEIQFDNIMKYLSIEDLLLVKNLSKKFRTLIIAYLMESLEKDKNHLMNIKDNLNFQENPKREGFENFVFSKRSKKAAILLNESELRCLFKIEKTPRDDIILIYRIYFQMIDHPFSKIPKHDSGQFWEKCRNYFLNENNGKIGDILMDMINKKKININKRNLYKIYNLVKNNFDKIIPNYYSDKCGTTGLFVFIVNEILEYLGISQNLKKKENAFWSYTEIIDSIDEKINYLKQKNNI